MRRPVADGTGTHLPARFDGDVAMSSDAGAPELPVRPGAKRSFASTDRVRTGGAEIG